MHRGLVTSDLMGCREFSVRKGAIMPDDEKECLDLTKTKNIAWPV